MAVVSILWVVSTYFYVGHAFQCEELSQIANTCGLPKQWTEWSSCSDDGVRQRKRNSCGGIVKIEEEICYPKFHATFAFLNGVSPPGGPRFGLPKTFVEAFNMNFKLVSDCSKCPTEMPGYRLVSPELDKILIYDKKGNIAGMHSIFPVSATNPDLYDYTKSGWYRSTTIDDVDYYMTTAYFIHPSKICNEGRTAEEVDVEGTLSSQLYFQVGETIDDLLEAPMTFDQANETAWWFEQNCFPNMGIHFNMIDPDDAPTISCSDIPPVQLIYHQGNLHVLQWLHVFRFAGIIPEGTTLADWLVVNPWEPVSQAITNAVLKTPPACLMGDDGLIETIGFNSQHVYFRDWKNIGCM